MKKILLVFFFTLFAQNPFCQSFQRDNANEPAVDQVELQNLSIDLNDELTPLGYKGFQELKWGQKSKDIVIKEKKVDLFGLPAYKQLIVDKHSKIYGVLFKFINSQITDRSHQISIFNHLRIILEANYEEPTHNVSPPQVINGEDAYVAHLISFYQLEWSGSETKVKLKLAKGQVTLEFSESPHAIRLKNSNGK